MQIRVYPHKSMVIHVNSGKKSIFGPIDGGFHNGLNIVFEKFRLSSEFFSKMVLKPTIGHYQIP